MKSILLKLFIVIATVELILMISLSQIEIVSSFFWLPMLLDALIISLTAILTVSIFIKRGLFTIPQPGQSAWIQIHIGLIVFFIEILIMQVFDYQPWILESWQVVLLDSFGLASLSSLAIYFLVLKPSIDQQKKKDVTEVGFDPTFMSIFFAYFSVITVLLMFLLLGYQRQFNNLQHDLIEQEQNSQQLIGKSFMQQLDQVVSDVLVMGRQDNVSKYLTGLSSHDNQQLIKDMQTQLVFKTEYEQLRLIDKSGQELVRIDRNENGSPVVVESQDLQNKSERYYFNESMQLPLDEVYISRIDLNIEHGAIELPYKPVIRVGTAVMGSNQVLGVVVLNLKAKKLLNTLANFSTQDNISRQLIDQKGYWIFGGEPEKQWGFMFKEKQQVSMQLEFPSLWAALQQHELTVFKSGLDRIIFQVIGLNNEFPDLVSNNGVERPYWYLVSIIPENVLIQQLDGTRTMMIYAFVFISVLLGLGAYSLTNAMRQKKIAETKNLQMVYSDSLTGLRNRKYFQWKLVREIYSAKMKQTKLAILYIDLNKFKTINDDMGHEAGDLVLKKVASILLQCLRDDDTVARIGGDEFAAILPDIDKDKDLEDISGRIISLITNGLDIGGMNFYLGVNIGIATMNNYDEPIRSFIARADQAMYASKSNESRNYIVADIYRTV